MRGSEGLYKKFVEIIGQVGLFLHEKFSYISDVSDDVHRVISAHVRYLFDRHENDPGIDEHSMRALIERFVNDIYPIFHADKVVSGVEVGTIEETEKKMWGR